MIVALTAPNMKAAITSEQPSRLRQLKKLETMRQVQLTALELFEAHGFDAVTIEDIAKAALVSAPTIYRHFGTKEGLVLWDEHDPVLLRSLAKLFRRDALGHAIRDAIVRPLDRIYAAEASRILRRVRLVENHPGLRAAVASNLHGLRSEMSRTLVSSGVCRDPLEADVVAGATTTALEIAVEHWAQAGGKRPLRRFIERALRLLRRFAETTSAPTRVGKTGARR
jgi:AcrR family transcriptional regulator